MIFEFDKHGMPLPSRPSPAIDDALKSLREKMPTFNPEKSLILRDVLGHFLLAAGNAERGNRGKMDEHLAAASHKADILIETNHLSERDITTVDASIRKLLMSA